jgi:hypothetical protein
MQEKSKMHESSGSAVAHEHSKCIERVLNHVGRVIANKHGQTPALERRDAKQTARNTFDIEYRLLNSRNGQLSLRFIVTGRNADLVLFQSREKPEQAKAKDYPGEIDQRVYRLEEVEQLNDVVKDKIVSHLFS